MKRHSLLLILIGLSFPSHLKALGPACSTLCHPFDPVWTQFKKIVKRNYQEDEEKQRYKIFMNNLNKIEEHNEMYRENLLSYNMDMNQFGDLTEREFLEIMFGYTRVVPVYLGPVFYSFSKLTSTPKSLDLRSRGMVTPVKDQGIGSHGAIFAAIGVLEGLHYQLTNNLVSLSEQHVLDCAVDPKTGKVSFSRAISFLTRVGAISEEDYPFEGKRNECRQLGKKIVIKLGAFKHVAIKDQVALEAVLDRVGPVSIQMAASSKLQFYKSGIFRDPFSKEQATSFMALLVGYGSDPEYGAYWLVKNSWGPKWGENGYIRIAKQPNGIVENGITNFPAI